jgi:uncharacterized protein (DUF1499 family)
MPEIGLSDGQLLPCPETPNCVSSRATDELHAVDPLTYTGDAAEGVRLLKAALSSLPRNRIVTEDGRYLHAEFTTRIMRFVDDVEFLVDENGGVIHLRSASRVGYGDLGANRKRVEAIREAFTRLAQ